MTEVTLDVAEPYMNMVEEIDEYLEVPQEEFLAMALQNVIDENYSQVDGQRRTQGGEDGFDFDGE